MKTSLPCLTAKEEAAERRAEAGRERQLCTDMEAERSTPLRPPMPPRKRADAVRFTGPRVNARIQVLGGCDAVRLQEAGTTSICNLPSSIQNPRGVTLASKRAGPSGFRVDLVPSAAPSRSPVDGGRGGVALGTCREAAPTGCEPQGCTLESRGSSPSVSPLGPCC